MSRKYELMVREGNGLCRIRALKDIPEIGIKTGDIGGYVQSERNLSQEGNCWVFRDAKVHGDARVCDDARIYDSAEIFGNARVYNSTWVYGDLRICDDAQIGSSQDFFCTIGLGSFYRATTFFRTTTGISVACGCFTGTLEEFRKKVRWTYDSDSKYAREYELACRLAELHILEEEEQA